METKKKKKLNREEDLDNDRRTELKKTSQNFKGTEWGGGNNWKRMEKHKKNKIAKKIFTTEQFIPDKNTTSQR